MSQEKKGSRKSLWGGLTVLFAFVLAISIAVGTVLEDYKATIDANLGTTSEVLVSESTDDEPLYSTYVPDEAYLNEDGTGDSNALIAAAIELNRTQAAEGAVLLKNSDEDGQGLPLAEGSSVTLLGIRSEVNLIGMSMGLKNSGVYITLEQALSSDTTDFANTIVTLQSSSDYSISATLDSWSGDEFEIESAGFSVNQTMLDIYETLNETYNHANCEMPVEDTYDPGEPSIAEIEAVDADYADSFIEYGDAAIVVIGRPSAESVDYTVGGVAEGLGADEPLQLTDNEREAIELAKQASDNVIVILCTSNVMEIEELEEDDEIDAILWVGFVGNYGWLGIADILCGRVSPSGALADTYATTNLSAPAMMNVGSYAYTNAEEEITRTTSVFGTDSSYYYVIEAEGIYVGYRYYETRYYDCVVGQGNADSTAGTYASTSGWNYDEEVVYSFGYGLSYTTFTQEFVSEPTYSYTVDSDTGGVEVYATFDVLVTNTGDYAGKSIVCIYGSAPYYEGGVEKSAIQLLNYEKSSELEPGESEVVTVVVDLQYIASYDETYDNGDGTYGTYILDEGTYYYALGNGAHEAVNNVLAAQGYTTADGMDEEGDASKVVSQVYAEEEGDGVDLAISVTVFSVSKTGYAVSNQLDYADWNYFQEGEVTYLSRSDWEGTYPVEYDSMTLTDEQLIAYISGEYYELQTDDDTSDIVWGDDSSDVMFYDLEGLDYDDELYYEAIDKMTLEEALYIVTYGGPSIPGISSLGTEEHYMTENAGNGIVIALGSTQDSNAPWAISSDDANSSWVGNVFGGAVLTASSFNNELYYELGAFIGNESLFTGISILWGPGTNTHRTAYNGRNAEYYSEDPVVCGNATMEFAMGALEYGLIAAPKHFAFNDQEINRSGIAPYMTEQKAREIDLRAFQIAFEATDYDTDEEDVGMMGVMISFSKIGAVECTSSVGLMTNILHNEWGFHGYAVTDIYDDVDLWTAVLVSGASCFDTRGMSGFYGSVTLETTSMLQNQVDGNIPSTTTVAGDATLQEAVKESAHNLLYAFANSNLVNRYNSTSTLQQQVTWWRVLYVALIAVSAVATVGCLVLYVRGGKKED